MKDKGLVIWLVCVVGLLVAIFSVGVWGSTGDPVIEGKTADEIGVTTLTAGTGNVTNLNATNAALGVATFKVKNLPLAVTSTQYISGTSADGTYITGASVVSRPITSGISVVMRSPTGNQSAMFYNLDNTAESGNTVFVMFESGDTVYSNIPCTAGISKFVVGGTTLDKRLVMWSTGTSIWVVLALGSPDVEAD